jgi:hypothetical protein
MTHTDLIIDYILGGLLVFSLLLNRIPKTYEGKFWNFLRANYHKHIFGGGLYGMMLSTTFTGVPIFMQLVFTIGTTWALGTLWEWLWRAFTKAEIDKNDVWFAVAASTIAVIAHM